MSDREQIEAFEAELNRLVHRFRNEFEITVGAVVGCLTIKAHNLISEYERRFEEGEFEDE